MPVDASAFPHEDPREIIELAKAVAEKSMEMYTHLRDTGAVHQAIEKVREGTMNLGRAAGESVAAVAGRDPSMDLELARMRAEQEATMRRDPSFKMGR